MPSGKACCLDVFLEAFAVHMKSEGAEHQKWNAVDHGVHWADSCYDSHKPQVLQFKDNVSLAPQEPRMTESGPLTMPPVNGSMATMDIRLLR